MLIYDASGHFINYDKSNFPGGEVFLRLKPPFGSGPVKIVINIQSSDDVMKLLMATDALRRYGYKDIDLVAPYFPYARQDRVCNLGESLSIKVMADLINSQGYRTVEVWDPHSDVATALIDRCREYKQHYFVGKIPTCVQDLDDLYLVAPDQGAAKKALQCAKILGVPLIHAGKIRDIKTGDIVQTVLFDRIPTGAKKVLIVDDVCDGGKTFTELARVIKCSGLGKIKLELYVTHGIFSKGMGVLKEAGIDHVYTANIWPDRYQGNEDYVTVLRRD